MNTTLLFVYNADSGLFNTVSDIAHKVLSPSTYSCNLCALTHGHFKVREEWVGFLENLDAECEFLHRDEFEKAYGKKDLAFPVIFRKTDADIELFADDGEINACEDLQSLQQMISTRL
jgi:hypothetical protein